MESKITIIKGSITALVVRLLGALFLLETVYAIALIFSVLLSSETEITTQLLIFLWVVHSVKFFASAYLIIRIVTETISKKSYITKHHLVVDSGMFTIDEEVYELSQLRRIKVHQNVLGRRLGYGSIELKFGARGFEKTILLPNVSAPGKYSELFESHLK